jgi:hypothetical protein
MCLCLFWCVFVDFIVHMFVSLFFAARLCLFLCVSFLTIVQGVLAAELLRGGVLHCAIRHRAVLSAERVYILSVPCKRLVVACFAAVCCVLDCWMSLNLFVVRVFCLLNIRECVCSYLSVLVCVCFLSAQRVGECVCYASVLCVLVCTRAPHYVIRVAIGVVACCIH